jgi:hypothetical protein
MQTTHTNTHRQRRDELGEKINQLRRSQNKLLIFQEELELRKAEATHHLVRPLLLWDRIATLWSLEGLQAWTKKEGRARREGEERGGNQRNKMRMP